MHGARHEAAEEPPDAALPLYLAHHLQQPRAVGGALSKDDARLGHVEGRRRDAREGAGEAAGLHADEAELPGVAALAGALRPRMPMLQLLEERHLDEREGHLAHRCGPEAGEEAHDALLAHPRHRLTEGQPPNFGADGLHPL
eukprot:CAMPEP_0176322622 /NCGR_PEP_ID=MMETSP0121_2-20121125/71964_1 /TAXON_ID=160619 /ORGANISM="Kryptoperidinium foliaceum, Strain CCMP 1326" /LENGTH=141 /DNA_ID=CAMNT_0017665111 /DNA_START=304 /DNA_END=725 /DNA_ORIENTATION=+